MEPGGGGGSWWPAEELGFGICGKEEGGETKKKMFISVDAGGGHCQPIAMSTARITATQPLFFSAPHYHIPLSIYVVDSKPNGTSPSLKLRCSVAKKSTISPSGVNEDGTQSVSVDCMVVSDGISGLCIAQMLAAKHSDTVSNVIVMEARDWVGGNIIIVEKGSYLGAERAASSGRKERASD